MDWIRNVTTIYATPQIIQALLPYLLISLFIIVVSYFKLSQMKYTSFILPFLIEGILSIATYIIFSKYFRITYTSETTLFLVQLPRFFTTIYTAVILLVLYVNKKQTKAKNELLPLTYNCLYLLLFLLTVLIVYMIIIDRSNLLVYISSLIISTIALLSTRIIFTYILKKR